MRNEPNYGQTINTCYRGIVVQAVCANFVPLLFLRFRAEYGMTLEQLALIPTLFFFTQLLVDFASAYFVDRIGYRASVVASQVTAALGLAGLAVLPELLPDPYVGVLICVVVYAIGSGLIEVLVSPIVEACPSRNKEAAMSLLHSFYCWGSVMVILGSTIFFALFGIAHWRVLACLWAALPALNTYFFAVCPIARLVAEGEKSMSLMSLIRTPLFWLLMLLMACAGAAELSMSQWASAFTEAALNISKTAGDLAGPCLFAVLMGISRVFYGKYSEKIELAKFMVFSGALCIVCYLLASLTRAPLPGLIGCALCGLSVGIMWPGTLSIAAKKLKNGGTALFAMLALGGDAGASLGPSLVGLFSAAAGDNLKIGLLAATAFPVILIAGLLALRRAR